jgi:hypothetical protein
MILVGSVGTKAYLRKTNNVNLQFGRLFICNASAVSNSLFVECGEFVVVVPQGCSGIAEADGSGSLRFVFLASTSGQAVHSYKKVDGKLTLLNTANAGQYFSVSSSERKTLWNNQVGVETASLVTDGHAIAEGIVSPAAFLQNDPLLTCRAFNNDIALLQFKEMLAHARPQRGYISTRNVNASASVELGSAIMPSLNAAFSVERQAQAYDLHLNQGALLVNAMGMPVVVENTLSECRSMVHIKQGALAMVALRGNRLVVLNLYDRVPGSCTIYSNQMNGGKSNSVQISLGQMAEFSCLPLDPQNSIQIGYKTLVNTTIEPDLRLCVSMYEFVAACRRFNLRAALPPLDLDRVVKAQASLILASESMD